MRRLVPTARRRRDPQVRSAPSGARPARLASAVRCASGQASVEAVLLLPLVLLVTAAALHVLAAGRATEAAGAAARAGAVALLQDGDPRLAAERALGGTKGAQIVVEGRRVTVTVQPGTAIPAIGRLLTAQETAHAGAGGPAESSSWPMRGGDGRSGELAEAGAAGTRRDRPPSATGASGDRR